MTLQDLGNIGEFIAAIGVIVSLVYLATQIRQNTRAVRSSASHVITDARVDFLKSISDNPEVSQMFFSGLSDREALDPVELIRFDVMMTRFIVTMENYHYQNRQGAMDPDQWTRVLGVLRRFMSTPGGQSWWSSRPRTDLAFDRFLEQEVEQIRSSSAVDSPAV
jgi:hypothetical protein